jgi:hypothetical protein
LVYFPCFCILYQEKSGNPGLKPSSLKRAKRKQDSSKFTKWEHM